MVKDMLRLAVLSLWLACAATTVQAQDAAATTDQLASQARYWEGKGRYDLARENWLKLLRSSPDNPTALSGLVNAEAVSGRAAAAQVYLDRLKEAQPDHPDLRRLEAAIRAGSYDPDKLSQPRVLARQGKYQQAVDAYKALFNNDIPGGRLGLEYYQTLAGTENGWQPAYAGIQKLALDNPREPIYQLALAQHLTYQESTRREGIRGLAGLSKDQTLASPARQAWRQALLWLGAKAGDEPLYQDYLREGGEDPQISAKLRSLGEARASAVAAARGEPLDQPPTPEELRGQLVKRGFDALNDGRLEQAEDLFNQARQDYGESADVLGGLGIIRLRQEAYGEAADLLGRASSLNKARASRWKEALDTARFWQVVRGAEAARKAGDSALAIRELRRALELDPKHGAEQPAVRISLADLLVEQEQLPEAEKIYRDILRGQPDNADALRGLLGLLARDQRLPEAIALAERAPPEVRAQLGGFGVLKAQNLRDQAAAALKAKDEARAETLLKEALLVDPESPWTRLDLARIYQGQQRSREASTLIDGLLAPGTGTVHGEALYIKALLLAEQQNWYEGLQLLERVEPGARTPGMAELQKRLWVRYQTQRASVAARMGQPALASQILAEVEPEVGEQPELLGALATAYADLGDESRALAYIRQALTRTASPSSGLRLQYAGLLFKLRQDAEFEVVMEDLLRKGDLDAEQSQGLANLRIAYRLRQADLLREDGDLARAYEYLEPLLRLNPNDPRLMMALARLYNDSKDYEQAYRIYQRVLALEPQDLDAHKGAINAALSLSLWDDADALLERAFALDPQNPRLYALAGRSARGRGDDGRALQLFQQALRLDAQQGGEGGNPFSPGNSQPLLQLIDPATANRRLPFTPQILGQRAVAVPPYAKATAVKVKSSQAARVRPKAVVASAPPPAAVRQPLRTERRPTSGEARMARLLRAAWTRGDVAIPARLARGRLLKVSTPPEKTSGQAASGSPQRPSGYWTEDGRASGDSAAYRYVEGAGSTTPAAGTATYGRPTANQVPTPVPPAGASEYPPARRAQSRLQTTLSKPQATLREELLGDIADLNRQPGSAPTGSVAPQVYYGDGYGVYEVPRQKAGGYPAAPAYRQSEPAYGGASAGGRRVGPVLDLRLSQPEVVLSQDSSNPEDRKQLLREIGDLRAKRSPYGQLGLGLRTRDGVEGLDRLDGIEAPVEVAFPATEAGRFKFRVVPVSLEAGTLSGRSVPLFGTLGLATALASANGEDTTAITGSRFSQSESGVALGLGYEVGDFRADFGTSPLGFPVETLVGGINWRPTVGATSFKIDVARRSVTDSLLSYAGARDPGTGLVWGGVTKTGGRLDVAYDLGRYGIYGNGSYYLLDGENLSENSVVEIGGGLYARAAESRRMRLTYGLNLTAFGYDKNLRRFSFGHGGYFSPQSYFAVSVPVEWEGYYNRFSYRIGGAIGIQAFCEDGAGYYPSDVGLADAYAAALELADPELNLQGGYDSKQSTGIGFSFAGQFEYLLDPNLVAGARLSIDNARDYQEGSALGYLRYSFYPQTRVSNPPALLLPYFNFGDPRL
ncbi:MAG: tetratricopeptide repeat protein [Nevskiaceae bacterium]|nr:MAG: tetratricopeptide repeat protein [Nevskiaceae bacterium]TAM28816.1 MAG: tetratricopeptide repeat protein [Nevskiaceae bacterium]